MVRDPKFRIYRDDFLSKLIADASGTKRQIRLLINEQDEIRMHW